MIFSKVFLLVSSCVFCLEIDPLIMMMMSQPTMFGGDNRQMAQMNTLMPLLLLNRKDSTNSTSSKNTDLLMLMMLQNPTMGQSGSVNMMLPLLLMDSGDGKKADKKALFLAMAMSSRQDSCVGESAGHLGDEIMMHMLLENKGGKNDLMMTMLLMQAMSAGRKKSIFSPSSLIPHLLIDKVVDKALDDSSESNLLAMVMMNSLSGGLRNQNQFDQDFNLLLPLALKECPETGKCEEKKKDLMVLLMAMQAGNPNSPMTTDTILPLLLMSDSSNNQNLLMFMMMGFSGRCAQPVSPVVTYSAPATAYQPVYNEPEPVYVEPAPVYVQPAPVYTKPVYVEPAPVYVQPAPVYTEPKYYEPLPVYTEPVYSEPTYVPVAPQPEVKTMIRTWGVKANGERYLISETEKGVSSGQTAPVDPLYVDPVDPVEVNPAPMERIDSQISDIKTYGVRANGERYLIDGSEDSAALPLEHSPVMMRGGYS